MRMFAKCAQRRSGRKDERALREEAPPNSQNLLLADLPVLAHVVHRGAVEHGNELADLVVYHESWQGADLSELRRLRCAGWVWSQQFHISKFFLITPLHLVRGLFVLSDYEPGAHRS